MTTQAIQGQTWLSEQHLWAGVDHRREQLNHYFLLQVLGKQAPLQVYPEAVSSGRPYRPEWDWIRISQQSKINLGGFRCSISKNWGHRISKSPLTRRRLLF